MRTKDVSDIILKGSPKQRLNLVYSHFALLQFNKEGFLTEAELKKIKDSFKTPQERNLYNRYVQVDTTVRNSLMYLNQLRLAFREQTAHIEGFSLLCYSLESSVELLNELLSQVKDKKLKNQLTKTIEQKRILYSTFSKDTDGYIILKPKERTGEIWPEDIGETGLPGIRRVYKKRAEDILISCKTVIKAIRDYLEENSFNIKEYKNSIKEIEADISEDKTILAKHSPKQMKKLFPDKDLSEFKSCFFYPDYDSLEIDEEQYKRFKEKIDE